MLPIHLPSPDLALPAGHVLVPLPFAAAPGVQEPTTTTDTPSGGATPGPSGTQTQAPQQPPQGMPSMCAGDGNMIWFLLLGFGLMYLMVLRPDQKRRKEQQALLASVKVGDRVVTLGGMHGEVASLTEKEVTLRVDSVRMTFDRTAIGRVVRDDAAAKGK